ncbi:permease [Enterococcus florum]|uniref:Permease n=1 Tax=Enterococcus florum TaxID=2480627 RepID=A0A4P5PB02_9ENTE|nr:AEC family transporter [Enterococcus florum]GCF93451.1 permease [Enterococcus florum]
MVEILLNSVGLFLIVCLGYLTKRVNLLTKADGTALSMIIVTITLPSVVIINLADVAIQAQMLILILVGVVMNVILIVAGHVLSKKQTMVEREFLMYSVSGYNVGNFGLPFVQSFLPQAIPLMSLFDIGNSVMLAGGSNVLIESLSGYSKEVPSLKNIMRRLIRSVPFLCYLIMLILRGFSIDLPNEFLAMIQPIANANTFLSMFMIGLFLELRLPRADLTLVARLLGIKYAVGGILAGIIALLPLPLIVKVVLCLVSLGPLTTFGVINSVKAGMRAEVVGFTSSVSFLVSLPLMTAVLMVVL